MDAVLLRNPRAGGAARTVSLPVETVLLDHAFDFRACAGRELVIIEGGDGTVQRVLSGLCRALPVADLPPLAVLPAGTTNMSCADFNVSRRYLQAHERLRAVLAGAPAVVIPRPLVRVDTGAEVQHGFCFCLGIIVDAVRQFAQVRTRRRLLDSLAIATVFARSLVHARSVVTVDHAGQERRTFAMVATTLGRLLYGMRPFAPGKHATGLHTTWIEGDAPGLWHQLPRLARGAPELFRQPGFRSEDVDLLDLAFAGDFVIDGEVCPNPQGRVRVSMSPPVRLLVL